MQLQRYHKAFFGTFVSVQLVQSSGWSLHFGLRSPSDHFQRQSRWRDLGVPLINAVSPQVDRVSTFDEH